MGLSSKLPGNSNPSQMRSYRRKKDLITLGNHLQKFMFQQDNGEVNSLTQDKHPDKSISDSPNRLTTLGCRCGLQLQKEWLHFTSPKRFLGDHGALWQALKDYKSHKCQLEGEIAERSGQSDLIVVSELTLLSVPVGRLELSSWTSFRTVRVKAWTLPSSSRCLLLHLCSSCQKEMLQL